MTGGTRTEPGKQKLQSKMLYAINVTNQGISSATVPHYSISLNAQMVNQKTINQNIAKTTKCPIRDHMYLSDSDLQLRSVACTLMLIFRVRKQKY